MLASPPSIKIKGRVLYWNIGTCIGTFSSTSTRNTLIRFREKNRRIVLVTEGLKPQRVRVFKWNEKLIPPSAINQEEEGRCWIFLLQINLWFIRKIPGQDKDEERICKSRRICSYINPSYSSSSRRNREAIFRTMYTEMMDKNFPEVNKDLFPGPLSRIINYVSSNFRFDAQTLLRPNGPMIVFVVEADRTFTVEAESYWIVDVGQHDPETNPVVDPSNLDEETILITLRNHLKAKPISPTTKLAEDEPSGLVEVKPLPALLKVQVSDLASAACPICLEGLSNGKGLMQTLCLHTFHGECISKWLLQAESCPTCRFRPLDWSPPSCRDISMSCCCGETIIEKRIGIGQTVQYECGCCGETIVVKRTGNGMIVQYKCPCGESRKFLLTQRTGSRKKIQCIFPCGKGLQILRTGEGFLFVAQRHGAPKGFEIQLFVT